MEPTGRSDTNGSAEDIDHTPVSPPAMEGVDDLPGLAALPLSAAGGRTVTLLTASTVLAAGVAFVMNLMMSRAMGPAGRGEVALGLQIGYLSWPLLTLGVERILLRGARDPDDNADAYWHVPIVFLVATVGIFAASHSVVLTLSMSVALGSGFLEMLRSAAIAQGRVQRFIILILAWQTEILVLGTVLYLMRVDTAAWWILPYAVPGLLCLPWLARRVWIALTGGGPKLSAIRSGVPMLPGVVMSMVALRSDRVILALVAGAASLGLYVSTATAMEILAVPARNLADWRVGYFKRTGRVDVGHVLGLALWDALRLSPIVVVGAVATRTILIPMLGPEFAPAAQLVLPLAIAVIFLSMNRTCVSGLLASRRPVMSAHSDLVSGLAALPIYYVLCSRYAQLGAAWASALVYAIGLFVSVVLLSRNGDVHEEP